MDEEEIQQTVSVLIVVKTNHIHHAVPVLKHNYHVQMLASVTTVVTVMINNPYRSHSKPEQREKSI